MSRYAISDIHGCSKTFRYLVEEEVKLQPADTLYLLGDYIDRGPDSKGVIGFILELRKKGFQVTTLCGNHEDMLLDARANPDYPENWFYNGGLTTLKSFNTLSLKEIPARYWKFIEDLELFVELDDYLLVHAGFDFSHDYPFDDREAMLWIREFEVDKTVVGAKKIVHGHTPISLEDIETSLKPPVADVLNIDGGCVFTKQLGYLTALNLDTFQLYRVKNREAN
ncbi:metallophosphoesterase family protein [Rufibacter latericius]|uniref:Serine/threonine protein phosphatase n=1 Tax=Rufibacter latericius TaxID=2487040 RepID=A0A3M9MHM4_9BACT|nr:metallophosphoesterase family protein [Rufibacter latericius]RNI25031.1 serine/threonine protein phosphatase [Rufibacter latericius]